ncbi:MAG: hypothetical protein NC833_00585 [Candidatus Omnitrophica bacterium]|nr:hypothetical protein [Candidatus Omnitrophota bacterium]
MKVFTIFSGIFFFLILNCFGEDMKNYCPLKIKEPPIIDGKLTESIWEKAKKITGFIRTDKKPTLQQTSVRICYDEKNLY